MDKYQIIAHKVAKELIEENNDMQNQMLLEVIDAMEKGEDIDEGLADIIFSHSFVERFMEELSKYEEE